MAEWARTLAHTIDHYVKGVETKLKANQKIFRSLKSSGRIIYNQAGTAINWAVEQRETPIRTTTGEDQIVPTRTVPNVRCSVGMKGYEINDTMYKRERLQNGNGPSQLVDYFNQMKERIDRNFTRKLGLELYVNDAANGNSERWTGLESIFKIANDTDTVNITNGTQRSNGNVADAVGFPSATYAGQSTALGALSGDWPNEADISTTWPAGTGDLSYDYFSPVIVNYPSSAFSSTATWAANCVIALRYGVQHMLRYETDDLGMKMVLLDRDLFRQFKDKQDSKEQVIITSEKNSLRAFGFKNVVWFDGVEISTEFGIPGAVGYGLNIDNMSLHSWQSKLLNAFGPEYEPKNQSWYTTIDCFSNLRFRTPRFFAKWASIKAS